MIVNEAFGIMDEGYFLSKSDIFKWINDLLKINVIKFEELGSGSVYCQIIDSMYPEKVVISKVNFKAKQEFEFIQNFKILQQSFQKLGIKRYIEVEKLIKCRYQDNLEFIQWMKRFFDCNGGSKFNYDPVERRKNVEPDFNFAMKIVQPKFFDPNGNQIYNKTQDHVKEKKPEKTTKTLKENQNSNIQAQKETQKLVQQKFSHEQTLQEIIKVLKKLELNDSAKIQLISQTLGIEPKEQNILLESQINSTQ